MAYRILTFIFILLAGLLTAETDQDAAEKKPTRSELNIPEAGNQTMNFDYLNTALLEETVLYYTNIERKRFKKTLLLIDTILVSSARQHSVEMASLKYLQHESPNPRNKTLRNRLTNAGKELPGTKYGENLGVDYVLHIAGIPFTTKWAGGKVRYYYSDGRQEIQPQTYNQFAKAMVVSWMNSPGHRANLLDADFTNIGIGASKGQYKKLDAVYITQNFWGRNRDPRNQNTSQDSTSHH